MLLSLLCRRRWCLPVLHQDYSNSILQLARRADAHQCILGDRSIQTDCQDEARTDVCTAAARFQVCFSFSIFFSWWVFERYDTQKPCSRKSKNFNQQSRPWHSNMLRSETSLLVSLVLCDYLLLLDEAVQLFCHALSQILILFCLPIVWDSVHW